MTKPTLGFLLSFLALTSAHAAGSDRKEAETDFIGACNSAFEKSNATEFGRSICQCTVTESRHQGVTVQQLKDETAKIRKDPKYKISNKALLASFHVCTISAMHGAEGPDSSDGKDAH